MKNVKALKIVALIPTGVTLVILLLFAVGESAGGDWSGLGHLIQALPIAFLMWLGWKNPLWGGILFLLLAFLALLSFSDAFQGQDWLAPFLIIIAPLLLSGLLFLGASQIKQNPA
jgi:hypothetical protein